MSDSIGLNRLKENSKQDIQNLCTILLDLLEKILKNPKESKLRRLPLESDLISNKLMPFCGGLEILFEVGFEDGDDYIYLPDNFDHKIVSKFCDLLKKIHVENTEKSCTRNQSSICASTVDSKKSQSGLKNLKNLSFANRLDQSFNHVMIYEDADLKQKCLQKIPVSRLKSSANSKYLSYVNSNQDAKPFDERDFLVLELLDWFKNEFFRWINQPECQSCNSSSKMVFLKNDKPNFNESTWMAANVEVYKCSNCQVLSRFPRYNHPGKLLDTRGGRCGEWANCFCLVLRSMDFDARYILDWTDHVWCEVYSESQKRWLHADPCENTLDKPLLYEHGWNKKLSYVIAFSRYECLDVTWRYSAKHKEVLKRRNECDEIWLVHYANKLTNKRIHLVNKQNRELRLVAEIVEFLTPKVAKKGEDVGRQSGSLQWRINRGEIKAVNELRDGFRFIIEKVPFVLKYNTAKNEYLKQNEVVKDWKSLVFNYSNIRHKVEQDWKMCYLEREKGSLLGYAEWYFCLCTKTKINLTFNWTVFESGEVKLILIGVDDSGKKISQINLDKSNLTSPKDSLIQFKYLDDKFSINLNDKIKNLTVRTELHKGSGQNAFQHAQLFRQSLIDTDKYLLVIEFIK